MTLIEVLAVVVIAAMAATVGAVSLSGAADTAALQEASAWIRDADQRARLLAKTHGPIVMELQDTEVVLRSPDQQEPFSRYELPSSVQITFSEPRGNKAISAITFDALGRSDDYLLIVQRGQTQRIWSVAGTTGWMKQVQP